MITLYNYEKKLIAANLANFFHPFMQVSCLPAVEMVQNIIEYHENLYLNLNCVYSNKSFVLIGRLKSLRNATLQAPVKKLVSVQLLLLCAKNTQDDMINALLFFLLLPIPSVLIIFFSLLHPSFFLLLLIHFLLFSANFFFSFSLHPQKCAFTAAQEYVV